jgi:hypothetical protein
MFFVKVRGNVLVVFGCVGDNVWREVQPVEGFLCVKVQGYLGVVVFGVVLGSCFKLVCE